MSRFRSRTGFCVALLAVSLIFLTLGGAIPAAAAEPGPNARAIERVMDVQDRHTGRMMGLPGVVGTATGLDAAGQPVINVFTTQAGVPGIPGKLDGESVVVVVSGEFFALAPPPGKGKPPKDEEPQIDTTARFDRPVPIGVSTGHPNITAGTIGCRVTNGPDVFALSNNHVYANENDASIGDNVLQPGTYDGGVNPADAIGTLFAFQDLYFDGTANSIDAAIALSSAAKLDNATPSDGYGTPLSQSLVVDSTLIGEPVQKYGRTTSLTKGYISAINASVYVGYSSGTALFVDQIVAQGYRGGFIKGGDSGSLLVTDPNKNPVGLLFAGPRSGKYGIANRIDVVLGAFGVTIDGEP